MVKKEWKNEILYEEVGKLLVKINNSKFNPYDVMWQGIHDFFKEAKRTPMKYFLGENKKTTMVKTKVIKKKTLSKKAQ